MGTKNKVTLIGNLGKDPKISSLPDGTPTASFNLATTTRWKARGSLEPRERTEWHRVVAYGPLAQVVAEHLRKGNACYLEGELRTRSWVDSENIERWRTEIAMNDLQLIDRSNRSELSQPEPSPSSPPEPPSEGQEIPFG